MRWKYFEITHGYGPALSMLLVNKNYKEEGPDTYLPNNYLVDIQIIWPNIAIELPISAPVDTTLDPEDATVWGFEWQVGGLVTYWRTKRHHFRLPFREVVVQSIFYDTEQRPVHTVKGKFKPETELRGSIYTDTILRMNAVGIPEIWNVQYHRGSYVKRWKILDWIRCPWLDRRDSYLYIKVGKLDLEHVEYRRYHMPSGMSAESMYGLFKVASTVKDYVDNTLCDTEGES